MKTHRTPLRAILFAVVVPLAGATAEPAPKAARQSVPNPFAPRFKQVRDRIDALYRHRNQAPGALDPQANPFRTPGSVPPSPVARQEKATEPEVGTSLTLLQQGAATLKVSGVFEKGGRSYLVINGRPYKEGDVVPAQVKGEPVLLRVREISRRSVTLVLNDAEMTLKF